jgi:sialate O-acetylesterase
MKLSALFSDNMVLQQNLTISIWGWDSPGRQVTIELAGETATTLADAQGRFKCQFPAMPFGGPHEITARGSQELTVRNVMVGEVWLCSGQSNMQCYVAASLNADAEIAAADYPDIRLFTVPCEAAVGTKEDIAAAWNICTSETVRAFSAVGYFFGRDVHMTQKIPVGLINASWGGTCAEAWTSREKLMSMPRYVEMIEAFECGLENTEVAMQAYLDGYAGWAKKNLPVNPEQTAIEQTYPAPQFDDAEWRTMALPGSWQSRGETYSGVLWFRTSIELPEAWTGQELLLSLGVLDKSDETYVNGEKVGSISVDDNPDSWSVPRRYTVPAGLMKPGRNVVAVRLFSNLHVGGFCGEPEELFLAPLTDQQDRLDLVGDWRFHTEHNFGHVVPENTPIPIAPMQEGDPNAPSVLFRNMINPIVGFAIRGTIWYQGESNAAGTHWPFYHELFSAMITDWRDRWGSEFPFYFVQLANYVTGSDPMNWAGLRDAQTKTLALPNTGMALTLDIGDPYDIHPTNKQDVGKRLSLIARHFVHGEQHTEYSGPVCESAQPIEGGCRIYFSHAESGLIARNSELSGFELACKDGRFVPATATIDGMTVVVSSEDVASPVAVRYAWTENPNCTLYNGADLPGVPFCVDVPG